MITRKSLIKLLVLGCLILLGGSCKKGNSDDLPVKQSSDPVRTAHGRVIGAAVKVNIGTNGGVVATPDNYISIKVPAGAVDGNTEFSIQEVLPDTTVGTGRLFRLLPEGVTLKKPVEITFHYTDEDIAGSNEDYFYPCFQDSEGLWHKVTDCILDKTNKTLKVNTTHFSDWSYFREISIYSPKPEIGANEEVDLEAFVLDAYKENENSDDGILIGSDLKPEQIVEWKIVSGGGKISGGKNPKVKYTAPDTDSRMEVMIEVTVKNVIKQSDPRRPGNGGVYIVRRTLTILPEEYVVWTIGGVKQTGMFFSLGVFDGQAIMTATSGSEEVAFHTSGTVLGKYSYGKLSEPKKSNLTATYNIKTYTSEYTECITFKKVFSEGSVVFETFGESGGGLVQGSFQGVIYNLKDCEVTARSISGVFRIKRTY